MLFLSLFFVLQTQTEQILVAMLSCTGAEKEGKSAVKFEVVLFPHYFQTSFLKLSKQKFRRFCLC